MSIKARLHNGDNCYKLVRFKVQKNIFLLEKNPSIERFSLKCKHRLIVPAAALNLRAQCNKTFYDRNVRNS